ncbi:MAG: TetR/AcrR family transcriptional regulator, partial [Conexibacteraceae bacterium]|nr:TetR/AcrR family transcriptional regulator [Conexibacteraceae bacterium]
MTATDEPPRRRGRPPSGGREAILDATLAVLREDGIANLTSRAVAARAGVSDASVYYHFRDRAGLLQAVFEHGMKPLMFMSGLDPEQLDPPTVIRGACAALEQF